MNPHITLLTLTTDNLDRALTFYRDGLGFPTKGIVGQEFEHGAVAFFDLQPGLKLAVWPRDSLAHDTGLTKGPQSSTECSIGHNVKTEAEVDTIMRQAAAAGATVVKPPTRAFWGGYTGYFADPDGHLWEIAFNPKLASA